MKMYEDRQEYQADLENIKIEARLIVSMLKDLEGDAFICKNLLRIAMKCDLEDEFSKKIIVEYCSNVPLTFYSPDDSNTLLWVSNYSPIPSSAVSLVLLSFRSEKSFGIERSLRERSFFLFSPQKSFKERFPSKICSINFHSLQFLSLYGTFKFGNLK